MSRILNFATNNAATENTRSVSIVKLDLDGWVIYK